MSKPAIQTKEVKRKIGPKTVRLLTSLELDSYDPLESDEHYGEVVIAINFDWEGGRPESVALTHQQAVELFARVGYTLERNAEAWTWTPENEPSARR